MTETVPTLAALMRARAAEIESACIEYDDLSDLRRERAKAATWEEAATLVETHRLYVCDRGVYGVMAALAPDIDKAYALIAAAMPYGALDTSEYPIREVPLAQGLVIENLGDQ